MFRSQSQWDAGAEVDKSVSIKLRTAAVAAAAEQASYLEAPL